MGEYTVEHAEHVSIVIAKNYSRRANLARLVPWDRSLGVTPVAAPVRSDADIETVIAKLKREPGGSFILPPDGFTTAHRGLITSLAQQAHLPFVAAVASLAREGGLLSYGPDSVDIYRHAASYIDRILCGTKPAEP